MLHQHSCAQVYYGDLIFIRRMPFDVDRGPSGGLVASRNCGQRGGGFRILPLSLSLTLCLSVWQSLSTVSRIALVSHQPPPKHKRTHSPKTKKTKKGKMDKLCLRCNVTQLKLAYIFHFEKQTPVTGRGREKNSLSYSQPVTILEIRNGGEC